MRLYTYIAKIREYYDGEKPIAVNIKGIHRFYLVQRRPLMYLGFLLLANQVFLCNESGYCGHQNAQAYKVQCDKDYTLREPIYEEHS